MKSVLNASDFDLQKRGILICQTFETVLATFTLDVQAGKKLKSTKP